MRWKTAPERWFSSLKKDQPFATNIQSSFNYDPYSEEDFADDCKHCEVYAFEGEKTIIKYTLTKSQAVCFLIVIGVGSNYIYILLPFFKNPIYGTILILFYCVSGFISCHYYI